MKVVLVTGSSRGLGSEIAISMAKKGYVVVINYNNSEDAAIKILEIVKNYSDGMIVKCDVSNEQEVSNMVEKVIATYGKINVLVNNAGISIDSLVEDKKVEDFRKILDVNLTGTFIVSRCVGKYMLKEQSGVIINIASNTGIDVGYPYGLDYDASKAGVISLTHNLSSYYKPYIRVNAICPGWIDTDMNKDIDKDYKEEICKKIKLGRFASREEIANVVTFLASDEASYINDSIIRVDGGETNEK